MFSNLVPPMRISIILLSLAFNRGGNERYDHTRRNQSHCDGFLKARFGAGRAGREMANCMAEVGGQHFSSGDVGYVRRLEVGWFELSLKLESG
jgi:hypothetical protein